MVLYMRILSFQVVCMLLLAGCRQKPVTLKSPPGYDFSKPTKWKLVEELDEISGLAWDHQKNTFAAIKDEQGRVYFMDREGRNIVQKMAFAGSGDYEDIVFVNSVPYILKSDGSITRCDVDNAGNPVGRLLGKVPITGSKDFESMYYDSTRKALIVICKNCNVDDKKTVSAFPYYLESGSFSDQPVYRISADAVSKLAPMESSRFQPSGAAVHPVQKKLYILSSASNQLVITDLNGNVEKVFVLAAKIFPQPEGIAIKQNGQLFIANEGRTGRALLLKFDYRR